MASSAVEVILKAIQDPEFREIFFRDKDRVLSQYRLSDQEQHALKELDRATFDKAVAKMEPELTRRLALGGADAQGARLASLDYPVIEDYDAG